MNTIKKLKCITLILVLIVNGSFAISQTKPNVVRQIESDTVYHAVTGTIYSISEKQNGIVVKYTQYYLTGKIQYYIIYEYDTSDSLTGDSYYDGSGAKYAYGVYSKAGANYSHKYTYYIESGVKIFETWYDTAWRQIKYTVFTTGEKMLSYSDYQYTAGGWLEKESYYDKDNVLYSKGFWAFDSVTLVTSYTYTMQNGKKLIHEYTGQEYDRYTKYYSDSIYILDSMKVYNENNMLFKANYVYNNNGWLTNDSYINNSGTAVAAGAYSFDISNYTTTYSYATIPDTIKFKSLYDYKSQYISTRYTFANQTDYLLTYTYNDKGYYSRISKFTADSSLILYTLYDYYEPYYYLKSIKTYNDADSLLTYYLYNEFGIVTDSSGVEFIINPQKKTNVFHLQFTGRGNILAIESLFSGKIHLQIVNARGQQILNTENFPVKTGTNKITLNCSTLAKGMYHYRILYKNIVSNGKLLYP